MLKSDFQTDWRNLYPFCPKRLDVGGAEMSYIDEGDGSPLLMVHGNPTWSFYWRDLVQSFKDDYRAIAVDHVGCGLSDKPASYPYCLKQHRDNLVRLIDELDLNDCTLLAHDWGGAIGLSALMERRDRFRRIVLFNTGAFPPPYIPFRIRVCRWPLLGALGVRGLNLFARAATTMATKQVGGLPTAVADGMLAPYDNWENRKAIYEFVKDIPLSSDHPTWQVLEQLEQDLQTVKDWPILLVWGMQDWCFRPDCLTRFEQHWPNAESVRISTAGHYVVEDAAFQVEEVTADFLSRT